MAIAVDLTAWDRNLIISCGRESCLRYKVELTVGEALDLGYGTVTDNLFGIVNRPVCADCLLHYQQKLAAARAALQQAQDAAAHPLLALQGVEFTQRTPAVAQPGVQAAQPVFRTNAALRKASNAARRGEVTLPTRPLSQAGAQAFVDLNVGTT
ncbi:hypothetical protein SISSUDRAFT_1067940 [Sistotremastrum suecicum HHB10207 ss-3]|uniref:Uncharacterized protein n=1 Tax=Sistotremastrum suecicum HHB10207 ss-3 TaxID=1314776 RepID=A0A165WJQ4_9AGAM|nr:hypothetical protein SISSUDRAFT_1067940 [Sistotremastrum suecicum HHB10207 ss-3]